MTLDEIANLMRKGLENTRFDDSLKFDCGDGVIVLADNSVYTEDRDADCTIRISESNLGKLITGKLNPMTGVMMGKLKVSGDTSVAMKLGKLLKS